ncbi:MAG: hypothetical protein LBB39_02055 [Mycoplasmataceae bacterium]|jgi:transposase|nr:hypothetical protein [Mycoplasmataceae bacterium]
MTRTRNYHKPSWKCKLNCILKYFCGESIKEIAKYASAKKYVHSSKYNYGKVHFNRGTATVSNWVYLFKKHGIRTILKSKMSKRRKWKIKDLDKEELIDVINIQRKIIERIISKYSKYSTYEKGEDIGTIKNTKKTKLNNNKAIDIFGIAESSWHHKKIGKNPNIISRQKLVEQKALEAYALNKLILS